MFRFWSSQDRMAYIIWLSNGKRDATKHKLSSDGFCKTTTIGYYNANILVVNVLHLRRLKRRIVAVEVVADRSGRFWSHSSRRPEQIIGIFWWGRLDISVVGFVLVWFRWRVVGYVLVGVMTQVQWMPGEAMIEVEATTRNNCVGNLWR